MFSSTFNKCIMNSMQVLKTQLCVPSGCMFKQNTTYTNAKILKLNIDNKISGVSWIV